MEKEYIQLPALKEIWIQMLYKGFMGVYSIT